jgi:hypothetical protein
MLKMLKRVDDVSCGLYVYMYYCTERKFTDVSEEGFSSIFRAEE